MRSARRTIAAFLAAWCIILGAITPAAHARYTYTIYAPAMTGGSMGFSIIQPHATTNRDTNPSFELATTGWTLSTGATIARNTATAKRGAASLKVTPSSTDNSGAYVTYSLTAQDYTWSIDFFGAVGVTYEVHYANSSGTTLATIATVTGTAKWVRISGTFTESGTNTRRIYVKKRGTGTDPFWIDGVQLEALSYATSYCDGDQPGCQWTGTKHASTSQRSFSYRGGGKKISLASLNAYLISQQGTGMATIENQRVPYAIKPGSYFQRSNVRERSLTIALSVAGDGVANWHYRRQALIDLIKPDLVVPEQPFRLTYDDGGRDVYLDCYYEDGLGIGDGTRDIEAIPIKCLATDPFWKVDGNNAAALPGRTSVANANYILQRDSLHQWSAMGTGANLPVTALTVGPDRYVYAGGGFTSMGGVSNTASIAKWDGTAWNAVGTGLNDAVNSLVFDANGLLYVGGQFSNAGGNANADSIATWDGSSWGALGTGIVGIVNVIAIGPDGAIYAGGTFSSAGGVANTTRIAKWNGSAWSALGTGIATTGSAGGSSAVEAMAFSPKGDLYVAGSFDSAGGVANTARLAKWNGSAWESVVTTFSTNAIVYAAAFGRDGNLYIGGTFTTINGTSFSKIARWNGTTWSALGAGFNDYVYRIGFDLNNTLIASGVYTTTGDGGITFPDSIARWTGSAWTAFDVDLPSSVAIVYAFATDYTDNRLIIGFQTSGTAYASSVTSVTNTGSAQAYPTIVISGPSSGSATLYRIANETIGQELIMNYTIVSGEKLTITFSADRTTAVSSFRGPVAITLPGSKNGNFLLLPSPNINTITMFSNNSTVTGTMQWTETGWSIDTSGT